MSVLTRGLVAATTALLLVGTAHAQIVEMGDAGQTVGSAQDTRNYSGQPISQIFGSIAEARTGDVDLFLIYIDTPNMFSASTINGVTGNNFDTRLYLFDAAGHPIGAVDDSAFTFAAAFQQGDLSYANLTAGSYILGISNSTMEPTNGPPPNQDLFAQASTPFGVRRANPNLNPTTLGGYFDTGSDFADFGPYRIDLTGVTTGPAATAVPEPATWAMMVAGFAAAGVTLRRRRTARIALA